MSWPLLCRRPSANTIRLTLGSPRADGIEHYWDAEADAIAQRLTSAMDVVAIRAVVVDVLDDLLGTSADGEAGLKEQSRRVDLIARAISNAVR